MRDAGFFPTFSFVLANLLVDVPFLATEAVVFTNACYWLSGLSSSVYFGFYLVVFLTAASMIQFFGMVAALAPTAQIAQPAAGLIIVLIVLFSGFIIARDDIPVYYTWLYYFSPIAWGLHSLLINEFRNADKYHKQSFDVVYALPDCTLNMDDGECFLKQYSFLPEKYWYAVGVVVLACYLVIFTVLQAFFLEKVRHVKFSVFRADADDDASFEERTAQVLRGSTRSLDQDVTTTGLEEAKRAGDDDVVVPMSIPLYERTSREEERQTSIDSMTRTDSEQSLDFAAPGSVARKAAVQRLVTEREEKTERFGVQQISATMPFEPMTLAWEDLHYYVDLPKGGETLELLSGISAYAKPGDMTSLMGSSGAGKTTLLDVIAGRKTGGRVTGRIALNGRPKDQALWLRVSGYVEQLDVHSPGTTVREAVDFSASLRLPPSVTAVKRRAFVEAIMAVVELDSIADRLVGTIATGGLTFEARKRLTIGVELGANPSVCFLDEPTSGLNSRAALVVVRAIKNVTATGRTVVCTIHQPSYALFSAFDKLLLLAKGGRTVYFGDLGDSSADLIAYFETTGAALRSRLPPLAPGANPATWMLSAAADVDCDFAAAYRTSRLAEDNLRDVRAFVRGSDSDGVSNPRQSASSYLSHDLEAPLIEGFKSPSSKTRKGKTVSQYATSPATQFAVLAKKLATTYWRSPQYNVSRGMVSVVIAVIFGSCYRAPVKDTTDAIGRAGLFYISSYFMGLIYMNTTTPIMAVERAAFYREQASSMYRPFPYALAFVFVEIPYIVFFSFLYVSLLYSLVDMYAGVDKYFWYVGLYMSFVTCFCFFGQFLVVAMPDLATAQAFGPPFTSLFSLFSGFVIAPSKIPTAWKFAYYASPVHWLFEGLTVTQFHDVKHEVVTGVRFQDYFGNLVPVPVSMALEDFMSGPSPDSAFGGKFLYGHRFRDLIVLLSIAFSLRVLTTFFLAFVRYETR